MSDSYSPDEAPKRRSRAWIGVGAVLLVLLAFVAGRWSADPQADPHAGHAHGQEASSSVWTCSMHPQIQSKEPGACPICGMDLIPLESRGSGDKLTAEQIKLSPEAVALARVLTQKVEPMAGQKPGLQLLGRVERDESRLATIPAWTPGRIEHLHVATTGTTVKKGQVVASLYSPEIYAAQHDLIEAHKQLARLEPGLPVARSSAQSTLQAARQRLRLLGVRDAEIKRMEQAQEPWRRVPIYATAAGTVLERLVAEGQYVKEGTDLYRVADLSVLWVQLDAYESDLPRLALGQEVTLTLEALPGETFVGTIAFIDPVVDPRTRTAQVRVEVPNPEGRLRPGLFAQATVAGAAPEGELPPLVLPASAVLFSGRRSLVYIEVPGTQEPVYEAREVILGPRLGQVYPVEAGVEYGERVVTHGAFRLDADLQIRGGRSLMAREDDSATQEHPTALVRLPKEERQQLAQVVNAYLDTQEALAADKVEEARGHTEALLRGLPQVKLSSPEAQRRWEPIAQQMEVHGRYFIRAAKVEGVRSAFASLTEQVERLLQVFGNPLEKPLRLAFCPMAFNNRGGVWFQRGAEIRNSYFGSEMLLCGEVREAIDGGAFKQPQEAPGSQPSSAPDSAPDSAPGSAPSSQATSAPGGRP